MLSIRTQDRMALVPYNKSIKIDFKYSYYDGENLISLTYLQGYTIHTNDDVLGTYETEERALEVLDEIQQHVVGKILVPVPSDKDYEKGYKPKPNSMIFLNEEYRRPVEYLPTVYEMPKE